MQTMATPKLKDLLALNTSTLRNPDYIHIIRDYVICAKDKVSFKDWAADIQDAPEDYEYNTDLLDTFIAHIGL